MKTFRKIHGFLSGEMPIIELSIYEFIGTFIVAMTFVILLGLLAVVLPCVSGGCS